MQPYPNFQTPMGSTPYPQMYGQPQMQQMPYMDRLSQLQAMHQNLQPQMQNQFSALNGRIVDSPENIAASDVPMDGSFAIFPKRDMSEVYIKYWTGEGKIATVSFKQSSDTDGGNTSPAAEQLRFDEINKCLVGIQERMDSLSNRLDEVLKSRTNHRNKERGDQ